MQLKLCKARAFTAGSRTPDDPEPPARGITFKIHKFTNRRRPDKRYVTIFPIFAEFGCETLGAIYCLPRMLRRVGGRYTIVIGWAGRAYFYRHLVDEYWEMSEDFMWLREYARAFHNVSSNLKKLEKEAEQYGQVVSAAHLGNVAVFPKMDACVGCQGAVTVRDDGFQECGACRRLFPEVGLFARLPASKRDAYWLPDPSPEKMERARAYLPDNPVAVTARMRKTWGRNLDKSFYERLIYTLEDMGYNPVWVGEKASSLPCPIKRIVDYSSTPDANDLETTLALVKQMKFTVQFWTASTRLAAIMGTPYLIFESPDQIWGRGQEGMRLDLLTRGPRKMVISHFKKVQEDPAAALSLVRTAVGEIEAGNFEDIIGMVDSREYVEHMRDQHRRK